MTGQSVGTLLASSVIVFPEARKTMDLLAVRRVSNRLVQMWTVRGSHASHLNVLIVIGDMGLRAAAEQMLESQGHAVVSAAHSGHALLACLTSSRIDVAFIESTLADMHGTALAERLRRRLPGLKVVFLAEPGTPATPGVVGRPLTPGELFAEIEAATSPRAS
jgi:CheY-like chemotaxis protein